MPSGIRNSMTVSLAVRGPLLKAWRLKRMPP